LLGVLDRVTTMAEDSRDTPPPPNPLVAATDKLRQSAIWLLGAFAAVGAVFAAGLQLANIGNLGTDTPGRLGAAIVGLILTVAAIVVAVSAAARVSARSRVNLALIGTPEFDSVRSLVDNDHEALAGFDSVADLAEKVLACRITAVQKDAAYRKAYEHAVDPATRADPEKRKAAESALQFATTEFDLAKRDLKFAESAKQQIIELATFLRVKRVYDDSKMLIAGSAATAALGIALFAWGANPPDVTKIEPGEVLPKTPSDVTILFSNASDATKNALGAGCDLTKGVDAVAMTVSGETYQVATLKTDTCNSAWVTVDPGQGKVVPRVAVSPTADAK
jgi:hypothetical protein